MHTFQEYIVSALQKLNWEPKPVKRLAVIIISLAIYAILFVLLQPKFQDMMFPVYVLPVVAAAWGFGLRGALLIGLLALPINSLLLIIMGEPFVAASFTQRLPAAIAGLAAAWVIGWLFDLHRKLQKQLLELTHAESRERDQEAFAGALRNLGTTLNDTLDPHSVFTRILDELDRIAPHDFAQIVLLDTTDLQIIKQEHSSGNPTLKLAKAEMDHLISVADSGKAVVFDQWPADIKVRSSQVQSGAVVPIRVEGRTIGMMMLLSQQENAFTSIHADRLQSFADHAAIAIRNAQMYTALESNVIELETLYNATSFLLNASSLTHLGQQIVQAVTINLDKSNCRLWLFEEDSDQIVYLAGTGAYPAKESASMFADENNPIAEAIRHGTAISIPNFARDPRYALDKKHKGSALLIPLRGASTEIVGVLDFYDSAIDAFSARDQRILSAFAERAAIAIENMRLYDTIHQFAIDREQQVIERTSELNRAKERVETILNSSSDTIILALPNGHIQQSNQAFYNLFGYSFDEEFDWPLTRLMAPDSQSAIDQALKRAQDSRRPQRIEVMASRKDGTHFDADMVLSPIHERTGGDYWGVVCSLRDISERKRMEQELRETLAKERELRELKSRFVSMASHEFRTPLATIQATASLLANYIDRMDEAKKKRQFEKIEEQIAYMTGLMNDVLTIGRMEAGKTTVSLQPVYLHEFFDELAEEFEQTQPDHQLSYHCSGEAIAIQVDSKLMREIVNNLLSNAAKYSPAGSTVHLDLDYKPHAVVFTVRDEGIGIPESDQPRLFEAFHRAENVGTTPGTGLGLSIVKHAVESHGGQITFETQVNEGTTFTVSLPGQLDKG
ncbi:MAG: hypothetical protein CL610_21755 [Anaerolineaceae bacterium]|nr:hypothetical protein [Anaerolineaceae bacterium]